MFRKKALEHAENSRKPNQLAQIVPTQPWLLITALWILLIACLLWGIFGSIPFRVSGDGLLLPKNGSIYAAVAADDAGRIQEILVKPQQMVKQGQIVAHLEQTDLVNDILVSQKELVDLKSREKKIKFTFNKEIELYEKNIHTKNELIEKVLDSEIKALQEKKELLFAVQQAYKKKLESKKLLTETAGDYYAQVARIESLKKEEVENKIDLENFINERKNQLREIEYKIVDKKYILEKIQEKLKLSKDIISPVNGIVIAISKNIGDLVQEGDVVLRIANIEEDLDAIIFVSPKDGKKIKPQMNALVSPTNIKKEEYGSIHGQVISVSDYPSTTESMMAILHNKKLVDEFSKETSPIAVRIQLKNDKKTPSGLSWSSSMGPNKLITPGTFVNARITVDEKSPLQIIIPLFKNLLVTER